MYKSCTVLKQFSFKRALKDVSHGTNRYLTSTVLRKTISHNTYEVTSSFSSSEFARSRNQGLQGICCQYVNCSSRGHEAKVKQFSHGNSTPVSYISTSSFFENKHGFSESHPSDKGLMPSIYSSVKPWNIILSLQTLRGVRSDSSKKRLRHTINSSHFLASNLDERNSGWNKKDYNKFCTAGEHSDKLKSPPSYIILPKLQWLIGTALPEGSGDSPKKMLILSMVCFLLMSYLLLPTCLAILPEIAHYFPKMLVNTQVKDVYDYKETNLTFEDIEDLDEIKNMEEFKIIVAFLRNPQKFHAIGVVPQKGVLLTGPPGARKILFAQTVAREAQVPVLKVSGSNFDGIFMWQGPKRVRDLFKYAKSKAPCIIFFDELDSVGEKCNRSQGPLYSNDVINQLLVEVDGLGQTDDIIVMGAANFRADVHKALLRPGRLDIQIAVDGTTFNAV